VYTISLYASLSLIANINKMHITEKGISSFFLPEIALWSRFII